MRFLRIGLLGCSVRIAAAASIVVASAATCPHALAQVDAYKQHMDNGVKLYEDKNYPAAIAEFEAAYKEKPKASPLINIALCHKAQFKYAKAIETLELALSKHGDTMDPRDRQAAESAIVEMKKLLAEVKLTVVPPDAIVTVDGEPHDPKRPLLLAPGPHRLVAEVPGKQKVEQEIQVVSGETKEITLDTGAGSGGSTTPPVKPPPKDERYSTPLMVIGIVAGGLGLLTGLGGLVVYGQAGKKDNSVCQDATNRPDFCDDPDKQRAAGLGLMIVGLVGLGVGIPMFVIGNGPPDTPKQPPKAAGTLWFGPGRIGATVAF